MSNVEENVVTINENILTIDERSILEGKFSKKLRFLKKKG